MKYIAVLSLLLGSILGSRLATSEASRKFDEIRVPNGGYSIDADVDPLDQEIARLEKQYGLSPARDLTVLEKGRSRFRIWIAVFSRIQPGCLDFVLSGDQSITASYLDHVGGQIVHKEISLNQDARTKVSSLYNAVVSGDFSPVRRQFSDPDEALMVIETVSGGKYKRISFLTGTPSKEGKSVIDLVKNLVEK